MILIKCWFQIFKSKQEPASEESIPVLGSETFTLADTSLIKMLLSQTENLFDSSQSWTETLTVNAPTAILLDHSVSEVSFLCVCAYE